MVALDILKKKSKIITKGSKYDCVTPIKKESKDSLK